MSLRRKKESFITEREAEKLLGEIFEECGFEELRVPISDLLDYSAFRKENYGYRRTLLSIFIALFALVPIMFVIPRFDVTKGMGTTRKIPALNIKVGGLLPIKSVVAVLNGIRLPVYEINSRSFNVEPTSNGNVSVTVTLFNNQYTEQTINVSDIDREPPVFIMTDERDGNIYVYAADRGSGVDFEHATVEKTDKTIIVPKDYDAVYNYSVFEEFETGSKITIPDNFGNILTVFY